MTKPSVWKEDEVWWARVGQEIVPAYFATHREAVDHILGDLMNEEI